MSEQRESYQVIRREYLAAKAEMGQVIDRRARLDHPAVTERAAEFEAKYRELLQAIDEIESQRRAEAQRYNRLKEAAWSVLSSNPHPPMEPVPVDGKASVNRQHPYQVALRNLAGLIDYPGWWSL